MAINKVEFGDQTLMDLTGDTVTPEDVLNGATFHDRAGVSRSGTASYPVTDVQVNNTSVLDGTVAKVTVPTSTSDLNNDSNFVSDASYVHTDNNYTTTEKNKLSGIASGAEVNVQSDWDQTDSTKDDYIKNKPSIPSAQVNSDWNATSGVAKILNKPTLGTAAAKNYTTSVTSGSSDLVTSGAVYTAIDNLPEPMVFKGSLGTGGTITALPVDGTATIGDTYKVITAGTYAGKAAKIGDTFICLTKTSSANTWELIPSGDEPSGTVTSVATGVGLTGGTITTSGTIKAKLRSETALTNDSAAATETANRIYPVVPDKSGYLAVNVPWTDNNTDTKVTQTADDSTNSNFEVIFSNTADNTTRTEAAKKSSKLKFNPSTGNLQATQLNGVTIGSSPKFTDNNTTYTFANGTNGFTVTPSGGSAQTVTVTPNDSTKLPLAGGTLTGRTKFNNVSMPVSAGKITSMTAGTTEIFKDGIAISNPTTAKDVGWVRVLGTGEADTVLEIATGDDGGSSTSAESIVARQYNTSSAITHEAKILDASGNTSFPKKLSAKIFQELITGSGTAAQDKGEGVSPRYFPAKWTFNTGLTPANGDTITIKIPVAGHDYGVFLSINNGTNYYPVARNNTTRLTTHYANGCIIQLVFESAGSVNDVFPLAGGDARTNVSGGRWTVTNFYDSGNTNNAVTQTASTGNADYEVLFSVTADNTTRTEGARKNSNLKFNPSTGTLTATKFSGALSGNADTASKLGTSNVGSDRQPIYLNAGAATAGNYTVAHRGNAGKSNMNDIARLYPSVGMTSLSDPSNDCDNPMTGTTKSTGWHLYFDTSYSDDPNGTNAWVAQICNKAGSNQWWVRSRNGGTITNGTAWTSTWRHLVTSPQAGQGGTTTPIYIDANGATQNCSYTIAKSVPADAVFTDTKNTAGSTDSSSKLFLIGATSQAANPQTYSHDTAYVGTDGCLYSGGTKVLTAHQDISGKVNKSGDTMTGRLTTAKPINQIITGSGTTAQDKGSGVSPRYFPAKWTFNTGQTVTNGDIITIKIPCAGHDYGVFISVDNGTTYKPISTSDTSRLTTHYGNASYLTLIYKSDGGTNNVYAAAGADARSNVTGGCWLVCNYYDTGNTYDRNRFNANIKAWGTKIIAGNIIVGINGLYHHLKEGTAFDITYPILYLNGDCNASATTTNTYDILNFTITTTQSITLTAYKPVYIKGTLSGTTFTPDSTAPLTQTVPTSADGKYYMFLGNATSTTAVYLTERHEIYAYKNGAFGQIVNDALSVNGYTVAKSVPSNAVFTDNDTKNTAGSTDTSSKIFLIGATSQAANPQTYSHDTAYVGTDGCLYSNSTKVLTAHQTIKQDGITGATINRFGVCDTAAATAAKVVSITNGTFSLEAGVTIAVRFTNANTATGTPTLNVNSKGAKNIFVNNVQITSDIADRELLRGTVIFVYDGTQWNLIGNYLARWVQQTATSTSADYEVLFSGTADNTTRTEIARKNSNLKFNPNTGNLTVTKVNGEAVFYSGSVSAAVNATTCTISNTNITTSSMIEPFSSNSSGNVITVTKMAVSAGKVVLTFPALTEATSFKVRITNT